MKKMITILLACVMTLAVTACSDLHQSDTDVQNSAVSESQETQDKGKSNKKLTEKDVIDLVRKEAVKNAEMEELTVDEESGRILDENDTAYIVGFDISESVSGNYMYIEAYWFNKETRQIKDVCSLNEYYDGLIDITKGESNF